DDVRDPARERRVELRGRRVGDAVYLVAEVADRSRVERHAPRDHLIEKDAEGPDVAALVCDAAAYEFGREVLERADDAADLRESRTRLPLRDAEIQQLDLPLRTDL